jgi:predicted O-methyltransferase YrrM
MRELEARDTAEREAGLPSSQRMRALVPEAGRFINMLIRACGHKRLLEIGTSYGYSTLWLATAAQANGGMVETLELAPERFEASRQMFARAGLSSLIKQTQGDARQLIPTLEGQYDFIFIDAEKDDYEDFLDLTFARVRPGGIIMADNVLSHADQLGHYIEKAQHTQGLLSVTVPVGRGEEMSLRVAQGLPPEMVATLAEMEVYGRTHPETWNIPRAAGKFLHSVAAAMKAKTVVELGTSNGYSSLWLASAMPLTGGRVLTFEPDAAKIKLANENFNKAKVAPYISVFSGKALAAVAKLSDPIDLVFIDADKDECLAYADALWPKLRPGALLVADNIDSHPGALGAYAKRMQTRDDAASVTLHIGSGLEFTIKS